ncbi:MAG: hypothetical protein JST16_02000 [Bdellovibrionales bacterium]|nr:hypothetical protein [Bdellovibrionales bacterium]
MKKHIFSLSAVSILAWALPAHSESAIPPANISDPSTLLGARSVGRGGATVASYTTADSLLQNPAGSVFAERYAVNVGYVGVGDGLAASVVDTKSGPIGGGLFYLRRNLKDLPADTVTMGDYSRTEERAGFSFSGRPAEGFGVGTNVKYSYRHSYDSNYPSGKNWNFDVGAKYMISPRFTVGAVGQNLLEDSTGLNPKTVALAVEGAVLPGLSLSAQLSRLVVEDLSTDPAWSVGGEYGFGNGFLLRAGYMDNRPWKRTFVSAGAGYETKSFGLDYAVQFSGGGAKSMTYHSVSLTGYL